MASTSHCAFLNFMGGLYDKRSGYLLNSDAEHGYTILRKTSAAKT